MSDRSRMIFLIKFFQEEEHAKDFVRGKMFANRLSYFKEIEGNDGRGDENEGAIMSKNDSLTVELFTTDAETGEVTSKHTMYGTELAAPLVIRPRWFDHVNVFCMYTGHMCESQVISADNAQDIKNQLKIPDACATLGKYAVVILNPITFFKRVEVAADQKGYKIGHRLVKYYDSEVGTPPVRSDIETIFTKSNEYEYQREYRIAIETGTIGRNPITLDIGKIDDIAGCINLCDINQNFAVKIDEITIQVIGENSG